MTFFGSTANDAAFNAWTADCPSRPARQGGKRAQPQPVYRSTVAIVAAGALIDTVGYFTFFMSRRK